MKITWSLFPSPRRLLTLFQQVYRPNDRGKMHQTLVLMERLSKTVSFWRFQCNNFKDNCFEVAYNALINDIGGSLL